MKGLVAFAVSALISTAHAADSGEVRGKVTFSGVLPPVAPLLVTKDFKVCGNAQSDESLLIGADQGIANAIVYLEDAPPSEKDEAPAVFTLDQTGCRYAPHVTVARVGSSLQIVNSDTVLHLTRGVAENGSTAFNVVQPLQRQKQTVPLSQSENLHIRCTNHPWSDAWLRVFDHPYFAITDARGDYRIRGVPEGNRTLVVWHERLGVRKARVAVTTFRTVVDFEYQTLNPAGAPPLKTRRHR